MTTNKQQQRFLGGVEQGFKLITTATGPYAIAVYDSLLRVDTTTGAIGALTLPGTAPVGVAREHAIVDKGGQANTNPITIVAPGGGSINGAGSLIINQAYGGVVLSTDNGLDYDVVGTANGIVGPSNAVYVDVAGNDATGTRGDAALPFLTIEAALAVTQDGDEVLIGPGVFTPTVVLSPPVGVRRLKIQGSGTTLNPTGAGGGSGTGGTVIDNSIVGGGTIFDFSSVADALILSDFATQGDINLDGSTSAGVFCAFGFFVDNVIIRDLIALDVVAISWRGGIIDGALITTCSDVTFGNMTISTGLDVSWDQTDANKPLAGRSDGVLLRACTVGGVTAFNQAKVFADSGTTITNAVSGSGLSVSGGLAPIVVVSGVVQGVAGTAVDFDTAGKQLPDSATACVLNFDGAVIVAGPIKFSVAGAPPTNRQSVSLRNATVQTSVITAGSAIDIVGVSLSVALALSCRVTGTPIGSFDRWQMQQDALTLVSGLTPLLGNLQYFDSYYGGTFTRASIAAQQYRAARTDGLPWMSWTKLQNGVRRVIDKGDTAGEKLRIELTSTNLITKSCDFSNAAWTKTGVTVTADFNASPDEGIFGQQLVYAAVATNEVTQSFATGANATGSVWLRCAAGTENIRLVLLDRTNTETTVAVTVTTTWTRYTVSYGSVGAGATTPVFKIRNGADGAARTVFATMAQVEALSYATSEIFTDTATVARSNEVLNYNEGSWPASFRTAGFTIKCYPDGSNGELAAQGGNAWGVWGANNGTEFIRLTYSSTVQGVIQVFSNSGLIFSKNVTWAKDAELTIQVQPSLGNLILSGFLTGNGTFNTAAWTFLNGLMHVGDTGAGNYFAGDLARFIIGG